MEEEKPNPNPWASNPIQHQTINKRENVKQKSYRSVNISKTTQNLKPRQQNLQIYSLEARAVETPSLSSVAKKEKVLDAFDKRVIQGTCLGNGARESQAREVQVPKREPKWVQ